jgi:Tol biopolymer transport system component
VNVTADGKGSAEVLVESPYTLATASWSPDGNTLAYVQASPKTGYDIYLFSIQDRTSKPFVNTQYSEAYADFCPAGRWLAYRSNQTGAGEVYIQDYSGSGERHQVSIGGGTRPAWRRDGSEIYYENGGKLMYAGIGSNPGDEPIIPRPFITIGEEISSGDPLRNYDIDSSGNVIFTKTSELTNKAPLITRVNLIHNWFKELKDRCPTGK